jgi:hypothetical protein
MFRHLHPQPDELETRMSLYDFVLISLSACLCGGFCAVFQEAFAEAAKGQLGARGGRGAKRVLYGAGWPLMLGIALCPAMLAAAVFVPWSTCTI